MSKHQGKLYLVRGEEQYRKLLRFKNAKMVFNKHRNLLGLFDLSCYHGDPICFRRTLFRPVHKADIY